MSEPEKTTIEIMRSPLGRVRGLGPARSGVKHWWGQRVTALALVPLGLWFVYSILSMEGEGRLRMAHWVAAPMDTVLLLALIIAAFSHMQLGLQVVIEDYIHGEGARTLAQLAMRGLTVLLALTAIVSVLKLAFAF